MFDLMQILFYGIPIAAVVFFSVSLFRYCSARQKNKRTPGSFGTEEMKRRKLLLIVSAVIAGILAAVVIGFALLLLLAVAYM